MRRSDCTASLMSMRVAGSEFYICIWSKNSRPKSEAKDGVNSHYRLIFLSWQKVYSQKEHTKISKIAKFGCEML
jgi:hypothetical protein